MIADRLWPVWRFVTAHWVIGPEKLAQLSRAGR
jgi:hypothetical protein